MPTVSAGPADDLPPGGRVWVTYKSSRIAVFNVDGEFIAVRDHCPHQGAPVCVGTLAGTFERSTPQELRYGREGRILTCPWHHWQFDLTTGTCLTSERTRLKRYPVSVEADEILVHI